MSAKSMTNWTLHSLVMLVLWVSCAPLARAMTPVSDFKFGDPDLKLLAEANELDRQFERRGMIMNDPELTAYVETVGKRVLGNDPPPERVEFRFRVLRDPMINAFALPNGSIYVNSGLLALLDNESELASVLGHEVTHVVNRHTYLFNRSARKKTLTVNVISMVSSYAGPFAGVGGMVGVVGASVQLAATFSATFLVATIYGYSRDLEREADRNGMDLLVRAGYDGHAMPRAFELLDEQLEFSPVENSFYSDHPKLKDRRSYTQQMADALNQKEARTDTTDEYLAAVAPGIVYNIHADLNSRRARTALVRATKLWKWRPDVPAYEVLVADAYRSLGAKIAKPSDEELGRHGQAEHRKRYFKLTAEEEQKELLAKPGGPEELHANFEQAEKYYLETAQRDANFADPHRGLGFLYEEQRRPADALREYRCYLKLAAPGALDRLRIERRASALDQGLPPAAPLPAASPQAAPETDPPSPVAPAPSGVDREKPLVRPRS